MQKEHSSVAYSLLHPSIASNNQAYSLKFDSVNDISCFVFAAVSVQFFKARMDLLQGIDQISA